jgi:hypothetical protein
MAVRSRSRRRKDIGSPSSRRYLTRAQARQPHTLTFRRCTANWSRKPFPFLRLPFDVQVVIINHVVTSSNEWATLSRSSAGGSLLDWKQSLIHQNDWGRNGLDFPKIPLLQVNRLIRDIGLRTIFSHSHPPVWLRRRSPQFFVKPIELPLAEGRLIQELALPACGFWQRLILPVKFPWAGQKNEIAGVACLLKRLYSLRSLHLEVYMRPQRALHASQVRFRDWSSVLAVLEALSLNQFSFVFRCDVNIPDTLTPTYPWKQLTAMEHVTADRLQSLADDSAKLFLINPNVVFDKVQGLAAFRRALRFSYDVCIQRFRRTFMLPLDQF